MQNAPFFTFKISPSRRRNKKWNEAVASERYKVSVSIVISPAARAAAITFNDNVQRQRFLLFCSRNFPFATWSVCSAALRCDTWSMDPINGRDEANGDALAPRSSVTRRNARPKYMCGRCVYIAGSLRESSCENYVKRCFRTHAGSLTAQIKILLSRNSNELSIKLSSDDHSLKTLRPIVRLLMKVKDKKIPIAQRDGKRAAIIQSEPQQQEIH